MIHLPSRRLFRGFAGHRAPDGGAALWGGQPEGWVVRREFNNPASIPSASSHATEAYIEGSPNGLTGGSTYRATSGYGEAPPAGGPAVAESFYPALYGSTGGGAGRFGFDLGAFSTDQIYIGIVSRMAADYPWSDNSNKDCQLNWGTSGSVYERALLSFRAREPGSGGYVAGRDGNWLFGAMDNASGFQSTDVVSPADDVVITDAVVQRGVWTVREWLLKRNDGITNGEMHLWVDGALAKSLTNLRFPSGVAQRFYSEGVHNGVGGVIPVDAYRWVAYIRIATP